MFWLATSWLHWASTRRAELCCLRRSAPPRGGGGRGARGRRRRGARSPACARAWRAVGERPAALRDVVDDPRRARPASSSPACPRPSWPSRRPASASPPCRTSGAEEERVSAGRGSWQGTRLDCAGVAETGTGPVVGGCRGPRADSRVAAWRQPGQGREAPTARWP